MDVTGMNIIEIDMDEMSMDNLMFDEMLNMLSTRTADVNSQLVDIVCSVCDNIIDTDTLEKHIIKHHKNGKDHKCQICKKIFFYSDDLFFHLQSHIHPNDDSFRISCKICKGLLHSADNLEYHIRTIHPLQSLFQCPECKSFFTSRSILHCHIYKKHKNFKCNKCNFFSYYEGNVRSHIKSHDKAITKYFCGRCDGVFSDETNLRLHKEYVPHDAECDKCNKAYTSGVNLWDHKLKNHAIKCDKCDEFFFSKEDIYKHKGVSHSFKCEECEEKFLAENILISHKLTHHSFKCGKCGKSHINKSELWKHKALPHGFRCSMCEMSFCFPSSKDSHYLKYHEIIVSHKFTK